VLLDEFKKFIFRGNLLDLAIAFVLGVAFATVVTTFTDGVLMALIAAIVGEPSFDSITIDIGDGVIFIGSFITAVVNFLIVAAALFFVMKLAQAFMKPKVDDAPEVATPTDETVLLREIRDLLRAGIQR
jgi:large conductance mechanosensitive channel